MIVQILSDTIPLFDTICKWFVSFMKKCLNSRSDVVSYVAKFSVFLDIRIQYLIVLFLSALTIFL